MKKTREKKKTELLKRVQKAKEFIKHHNVKDAKNVFCDTMYGAMYKAESTKVDNLWAGRTTDEDFTIKLEEFAKNPRLNLTNHEEFKRFMRFVDWYMELGGAPLTPEQIEKAYPKFKI